MRALCGPYGNRMKRTCEVRDDEVSTNNDEGPPVPIPNTEVKLISGDNTWLATAREDSTALTQRSSCRNAAASFFIQIGPASLGSDLSRTASPLRASGGHFDTCGDSGILARK